MGVRAPPCVGLDESDRLVHPRPRLVPGRRPRHRSAALGCARCDSSVTAGPPVGAATNVSRVYSGRKQKRTGWNGEVPIPADTCNCMLAPQLDVPLALDRSRPQLVTSAP